MKKQLYILITILACISFIVAGCGSGANKSKAADTAGTSSTETKTEFGHANQKQKEIGKKFVGKIETTFANYADEEKKLADELESIEKIENQSTRLAKAYDIAVKRHNLAVKYYKKCDEFSTAGMEELTTLQAEKCRLKLQQFFQTRADSQELVQKLYSGQISEEEYNSEQEHQQGLQDRYVEDLKAYTKELKQNLK